MTRFTVLVRTLLFIAAVILQLTACGGSDEPASAPAIAVTALTIMPADVPVTTIFVAQTKSSQAVNIQARVSGFLEKRIYTEGASVKTGQVLFEMDKKPFQAQVDGAAAALQRNEAALEVARTNLARTKPLVELNALSQRDLDDARGQFEQSAAAVAQSKAQLDSAQLDLSYATIRSPVDGVSSFSAVADGTYLDSKNAQLTTVSVLSPMWINFSLSENDMERVRREEKEGRLKPPEDDQFTVEVELADGSLFPQKGKIDFTDPSYNPETGTFLIRAVVENPDGVLRPNQYVRTKLVGATRPNAILVPQRAVQQSAQGHFVWIVNKSEQAEMRPVVVGTWHGDNWFINEGLASGDRVVVDGALRLAPGTAVAIKSADADADADAGAAKGAAASTSTAKN
jgi:membrane fusion protein (multidrug efflux system)